MVSHTVTARITFPDPGRTGRPGTFLSRFSAWVLSSGSLLIALILFGAVALIVHRRRSRIAA
jgi:hypothetical protein